ncbi:MAG: hypothetical protein QXU20_04340 [Candidatus Woesearchaeota archaeon]
MSELELKIMDLWNKNNQKIINIVKNKESFDKKINELRNEVITAKSIKEYFELENKIKEALKIIEDLKEIRGSFELIPSLELNYKIISNLKERANIVKKELLNKTQNNFYYYTKELEKKFDFQEFQEANEIRKKINLNAVFYKTLLKPEESFAENKRRFLFNKKYEGNKAILDYCENLKEYYTIPRKIKEISKEYKNKDWNNNNINLLRQLYENNFVTKYGKEDLISKIKRLNFIEFLKEAQKLKDELEFFLQRYNDIVLLKRDISKNLNKIKELNKEIESFNDLSDNILARLSEVNSLLNYKIDKEFFSLSYLQDILREYTQAKDELNIKFEKKIFDLKLKLETKIKDIISYTPDFRSIEIDNKNIEEKLLELKDIEKKGSSLKNNFGLEIYGFKEADKQLKDYLNKIIMAEEKIKENNSKIEEIKKNFELLIESKDKTKILKFENELNTIEQYYEGIKNEPYLEKTADYGIKYIHQTRESLQKLKSLIEEEEKNNMELELRLKELSKEPEVYKDYFEVTKPAISPYLYFNSLGPTPNPTLFLIREELMDSKSENIREKIDKVYNAVKNMEPVRTHSEFNYMKRIIEGYKNLINFKFNSIINKDKDANLKFNETLKIMDEKLNITKKIIGE